MLSKHNHSILTGVLAFTLLFVLTIDLTAQPINNGRTVGLAAAGSGMMYGANAAGWNAANLGMKDNPNFSMSLLSMGFSFGNNSFTPEYISDSFIEGDTLFDEDKQDIIGKLDSDGLKLFPQIGIPIFGISVLDYALNVDFHGHSFIQFPTDIFEMALYGPQVDEYYDLSKFNASGEGYTTVSLSAAKSLTPPEFLNELSVGATFKFISGNGYGGIDEASGKILVSHDNLETDGAFKLIHSTSGDGVGLDLSVASRTAFEDIYVGLTLGNLIGEIRWTDAEIDEFTFFHEGAINMEKIQDKGYIDSLFTDSDTTYAAADFTTSMPRYVLLSASKQLLTDWTDFYFSWYQGLNDSPAHNTTPKISVATEISYISFLPLRLGMSFGGLEKTVLSTGFGIDIPSWKMDFGFAWQRGLFFGAEGLSIGFSNTFGG